MRRNQWITPSFYPSFIHQLECQGLDSYIIGLSKLVTLPSSSKKWDVPSGLQRLPPTCQCGSVDPTQLPWRKSNWAIAQQRLEISCPKRWQLLAQQKHVDTPQKNIYTYHLGMAQNGDTNKRNEWCESIVKKWPFTYLFAFWRPFVIQVNVASWVPQGMRQIKWKASAESVPSLKLT